MAEQNGINWLNGIANVPGIVEKICPGRHIRQNEWQPQWNETYLSPINRHKYDYISDYECIFNHPMDHVVKQRLQETRKKKKLWKSLQAAKAQGCSLQIKDLAHFTNPEAAKKIVTVDNGFRGGLKKINEDENHYDVCANLSWWSPVLIDAERNILRRHLGEVIQPFIEGEDDDLDALKDQFATSDAFQPNPRRYGSHLFRYEQNELCETYSKLIHDELCYKILGTFGYKQEVMHTVLVCSKADGAGQFAGYPDVLTPEEDINNEAVITRDSDIGNWYWRPQATGGGGILRLEAHWQFYPQYRRWEHVAFAFHIPDGKIMVCESLPDHHKLIMNGNIVDLPGDDNDDDGDED